MAPRTHSPLSVPDSNKGVSDPTGLRMKPRCPGNSEREALAYFLSGGYCPQCATFDERAFGTSWRQTYFLVSSFVRRFNWRDYHAADGDPTLSMVAGEIWLYNIGRMLAREMDVDAKALSNDTTRRRLMPKCNAYSLSQALGVPPQTVRRKVTTLIERGLAERSPRGELMITAAGEAAFDLSFTVDTMRDFISTARAVFETMGLSVVPASAENSAKASGQADKAATLRAYS